MENNLKENSIWQKKERKTRLYKVYHETTETEICILVVAYNYQEAKSLVNADDIWCDSLPWWDYITWLKVKRKKDVDASKMEWGIVDWLEWTRLWLYSWAESYPCDKCKKPSTVYHDNIDMKAYCMQCS